MGSPNLVSSFYLSGYSSRECPHNFLPFDQILNFYILFLPRCVTGSLLFHLIRYLSLFASQNCNPYATDELTNSTQQPQPSSSSVSNVASKCCSCHRLSTFVLDISEAVSAHVVTWLPVKSNAGLAVAPEETILYSLVRGRSEMYS